MAFPARADYHYASHQGSDQYPYTSWETAADSIQKAVDATDPHDTVYVGSGDWYQYVQTGVYDSVSIIGMGTDSTFCHYDSTHGSIFSIDYYSSVEAITFSGAPTACIYAEVYADVTIRDCRFLNANRGIGAAGYPVIIEDCIFDNCGTAIESAVGGEFHISNNLVLGCYDQWAIRLVVHSALVQNNIIINQPGAHVSGINSSAISGQAIVRNNIVANGNYGITVDAELEYNNIVDSSRWQGMGIGYQDVHYNNSLSNCGYGVEINDDYSTLNYNNYWNNGVDFLDNGREFDSTGNIFCNPMYVSDDDYHLQAFSPLIDAGDPDYLDFDGTRSDIGAYGGPYGESYLYQDLPPHIPDNLSGEFIEDTIILNWRYNTEADFSHYLLHRDTVSGFEPSEFNLIAYPDTSYYADTDVDIDRDYFYRIASADSQGNMSDYSEELGILSTGIGDERGTAPPQVSSIRGNYPNPFNSSTTIVYYVADLGPVPARIEIDIYDIAGRKVRNLVNERRNIGEHRMVWDGRDDQGHGCATGIYFARITQWGFDLLGKPRKLVLIK